MPAKKRRKRHKRSIPILTSTKSVLKNRQYFQHDNRSCRIDCKIRNNYTKVAKKFRPLIKNDFVNAKEVFEKIKFKNNDTAHVNSADLLMKEALSFDTSTHLSMLSNLALATNRLPLLMQSLHQIYFKLFAHNEVLEQEHVSNFTKRVRETHQVAAAQQEKNAKLREAFNIGESFVEGSSFGSYHNKDDNKQKMALQKELNDQIGVLHAETTSFESEKSKKTSSHSKSGHKSEKKKKKKRQRSRSSSEEYRSDKVKKSKKQKKERLVY